MLALARFSAWVGRTFALWAVVFAVLGFVFPQGFVGLKGAIVPVLGVIMFGMGLTLEWRDFAEVVRRPLPVLVGVVAQFLIMPLLALLLVRVFSLPAEVALGVILVGCCPGGTSSNVMTFLARGDVALSVTITAISMLLAPVITPLLLQLYAGTLVEIALLPMMWTIAKIVLLPIAAGVGVQRLLGMRLQPVVSVLPLVSALGIALIIAIVVALSQQKIAQTGMLMLVLVMLHNGLGYLLGFVLGKLCGFGVAQQRAIMIEVGMQNSGLGAALATKFFDPISAVPSALFSVWHNISGALLANFCAKRVEER